MRLYVNSQDNYQNCHTKGIIDKPKNQIRDSLATRNCRYSV